VKGITLMVMRNRHEGGGAHWWDDLPPHTRNRFSQLLPCGEGGREAEQAPARVRATRPAFSQPDLLVDLSKFAILLCFISAVILLYLLVAMSYVAS